MKGFYVLVLTVLFSANLTAKTKITSDVIYGHKAGMALTYDVFVPEDANGAAVIYLVSGGWFSNWQAPDKRIGRFEALLSEGFTVYAVHHGSAPRFKVPEAVSDVRAAVRHVRIHAAEYNVDTDRIGVLGGSAGGHLSLMLGLNSEGTPVFATGEGFQRRGPEYEVKAADDARVAAIVAYYPPVDIRPLVGPSDRFPALDFPEEQAPSISPILFVTKDDPPTKLIHGDADKLVPIRNSEALQAALEKAGVTHDYQIIKGAGHGFRNPVHRAEATRAMVAWFKEHLKAI